MQHILIISAKGYIGSHVVSALLEMGHEVTACDLRVSNIVDCVEKVEKRSKCLLTIK